MNQQANSNLVVLIHAMSQHASNPMLCCKYLFTAFSVAHKLLTLSQAAPNMCDKQSFIWGERSGISPHPEFHVHVIHSTARVAVHGFN